MNESNMQLHCIKGSILGLMTSIIKLGINKNLAVLLVGDYVGALIICVYKI